MTKFTTTPRRNAHSVNARQLGLEIVVKLAVLYVYNAVRRVRVCKRCSRFASWSMSGTATELDPTLSLSRELAQTHVTSEECRGSSCVIVKGKGKGKVVQRKGVGPQAPVVAKIPLFSHLYVD